MGKGSKLHQKLHKQYTFVWKFADKGEGGVKKHWGYPLIMDGPLQQVSQSYRSGSDIAGCDLRSGRE